MAHAEQQRDRGAHRIECSPATSLRKGAMPVPGGDHQRSPQRGPQNKRPQGRRCISTLNRPGARSEQVRRKMPPFTRFRQSSNDCAAIGTGAEAIE